MRTSGYFSQVNSLRVLGHQPVHPQDGIAQLSSEEIGDGGGTNSSSDHGPLSCSPLEEDRSNSYFMVAVVRRDSSYSFTLDELRGKRSCHPGLGSPAGWDVPIGSLIQRGFIRPKDCDVLTGSSL